MTQMPENTALGHGLLRMKLIEIVGGDKTDPDMRLLERIRVLKDGQDQLADALREAKGHTERMIKVAPGSRWQTVDNIIDAALVDIPAPEGGG